MSLQSHFNTSGHAIVVRELVKTFGERRALDRLMALIQALGPPDRQVALLYLEDLDAAAIGEVTGLSPGAVAVRIHRLKALLARRFAEGGAA